jgi:FtsP/CotA-like multicopper oxidase with cupredoxin domain
MSTHEENGWLPPRAGITRRTVLGTGAMAAALAPALVRRAAAQQARTATERRRESGELPWRAVERRNLPPGEPGRDYTPVYTPNGVTLEPKIVGGVKVFHLVAEPIEHELAEGLTVQAWGYNGRTPGPTIELVEGDRARFYVTNRLPASTSVHWHGLILPNGMDGVPGITQPPIPPGETFVYEFTFAFPGTFMYHPHSDSMTEEGLGMIGMIVVHPRLPRERRPDRDFAITLMEWKVPGGTRRPDPNEMVDFNVLTMNGRAFPDTGPLVAELGDRVRIRMGNLSQMSHHPIHLHGYAFEVTETDGGEVPPGARWPETTVLVPVGSTRTIEFVADNPGDWLMHCHMTHHMMNQMGHGLPNMIGVDARRAEGKIRSLLPGYMTMGQDGMEDMARMADHMPLPPNSIPMRGFEGQFGATVMGGMATLLKVREHAPGYEDPGPYAFAPEDVSYRATDEQLAADGIDVPPPADSAEPDPEPAHRHARVPDRAPGREGSR